MDKHRKYSRMNATLQFFISLMVLLLVHNIRAQNVEFTKEFLGAGVAGGTVDLEFTITNNEASPITNLQFTDDLDAVLSGMVAVGLPMGDVCRSGSQISGTSLLSFMDGGVPGGGSCSFTVSIQIPLGASPGTYPNTTSQLSGDLGGNPFSIGGATDNLVVEEGPAFTKSFSPSTIALGGSSTLTFVIDNSSSATAASGLDFTDNLPSGLMISNPANASTTCTGGTLTAMVGSGTISYTGGAVAAGAVCNISVDVTGTANGMHQNTTGDLTSSLGNSGPAISTLTVAPMQPLFEMEFTPDQIMKGEITTLTYTITNPNGAIDFSALGFVDDLPPGLAIAATPIATTSCAGAMISAPAGGTSILFSDGALSAMGVCTVQVDVTGNHSGFYQNDAELNAGRDPIPAIAFLGIDPELNITLEDSINFDPSMDMIANPHDSIRYTLEIENIEDTSVYNLGFDRGSDPNITLDPSTIQATPVAINDNYELMGSPMNVPMGTGLLANDADINDPLPNPPFNSNLSVLSVQGGPPGGMQTTENGGSVLVNSNGAFTYDSTGVAMAVVDSFFYKIIDSEGFIDSARVIVYWTRPPLAQDDSLLAQVNIINNYAPGTLFNDNGNGPDDLGIPAGSLVSFGGGSAPGMVTTYMPGSTVAFAGGNLTVNLDGSIVVSNPTISGVYTFEYRIQNGSGFSDALVAIGIQGPPDGYDDSDPTVLAGTSAPGDNDFHIMAGSSSIGVINVYTDNGFGTDNLGLPTAPGSPPADVIDNVNLAGTPDAGTGTIGGGSFAIGSTGSIEITTAGELSLTPPTGFVGMIEFDYILANFIASDPTPATVSIAVGARPVATNDSYNATGNISINTTTVPGNDLLANDTGDGISVTTVQGSALNVGVATATMNGGNVLVQANGEFVYTPPTGFTGNDTYTYTVGNGFGNSTQATVTIAVSGLMYFMDDAAAAGGDGSLLTPYKTIAEHNGAPPPSNAFLFVEDNGNLYSGNLTLVNGETVIGEGSSGSLFGGGSLTGITLAPLSVVVSYNTSGNSSDWAQVSNPAGHAVTLHSGNTITGLSIGNRMNYAFTDNGASVGSLSLKESEVTGTGAGVKIENGGALDVSLTSLNTSGGAYGLWLKNASGMVTVSGGAITNPTTSAITVDGGSVNANFTSGSISQTVNTNTVSIVGGHSGVLTYSGTISSTNGNGLQFNNADGQYNFNNVVTLSGGDAGIDILNGSGGSFTFSNTTITNPSGTAFNVNNSSASISYLGGNITQNSTASGVVINSNSSTVTLGAQLNLNTGSNAGINVQGGGVIQITNANNTVTTTTATSVTINGTTIGASGVALKSVSCNGATRAIYLNNAGPSPGGFFTVSGTGTTDGSGGTIQNITNRGVEIVNTDMVTLRNMNFNNVGTANGGGTCNGLDNIGCNAGIFGAQSSDIILENVSLSNGVQVGINGKQINNLTITNSTVQGFGDQVNEHGVYMRELTGTVAINNSTIRTSSERNALLQVSGGTLNFSSTGSTYSESSILMGADGLEFNINGSALATIDIDNCSFLQNRTNGLQVLVEDNANVTQCDVTNSTFDPQGGIGIGIDLGSADNAQLLFNVINNPKIYSNGGPAVNIISFDDARISGRVNSNPDIQVGGMGTSGIGISVNVVDEARGIVEINNNIVGNIGNDIGIDAVAQSRSTGMACGTGCSNGRLDVTITNNDVTVVDPMLSLYDIRTQAQDENTVCTYVANNTASNVGLAAYRSRTNAANATLVHQGFATSATMTWAVNGNTPTTSGAVSDSHVVGVVTGGVCAVPTHPMP